MQGFTALAILTDMVCYLIPYNAVRPELYTQVSHNVHLRVLPNIYDSISGQFHFFGQSLSYQLLYRIFGKMFEIFKPPDCPYLGLEFILY